MSSTTPPCNESVQPTLLEFDLEDGLVDPAGHVHTEGLMRAAAAADEILALKDFRVHLWPDRYLDVVLPRVIVKLGKLGSLHAGLLAGLSSRDRLKLEAKYRELNGYAE